MKSCLRIVFAFVVSVAVLMSGTALAQSPAQSFLTDTGRPGVIQGIPPNLGAPLATGVVLKSTGTPNIPARLFRDGNQSMCGTVKGYPGTTGSGGYAYVTKAYTNTGAARCITFTITPTSVTGGGNSTGVFFSAYNAAFNPLDLSQNYLGDTGSSASVGTSASMKIDLTAGQSITLVVMQLNNAATSPENVAVFDVFDDTAAVPAFPLAWLVIAACVIGAVGFFRLRRRSLFA